MQNIAIIKQGTGRYLFSIPDNITLREGDRVKCDTQRGITDGIAFADSAWVDENVSQLIGKLTGAKFPLKSVVGRLEYLPFEKPQDKPAANPANKYEGMSNRELVREMCSRGLCHARDGWGRKHDCLFVGTSGCDVTAANRDNVIEYLLAEDAEEEQKPEGKPAEDKQEPIKLYCVKDFKPGEFLTKGKIYEIAHDGAKITYDDGWATFLTISSDNFRGEKIVPNYLVPLVKRPAKVGEWVLFCHAAHINPGSHYKNGDIYKCVKENACFKNDICVDGVGEWIDPREYLVLDGYQPEPEPEYWSGKVVCVSSVDKYFTVGKIYEFIYGEIKDDAGDTRPMLACQQFKSVEEWNEALGGPIARFIEFKGEAHD